MYIYRSLNLFIMKTILFSIIALCASVTITNATRAWGGPAHVTIGPTGLTFSFSCVGPIVAACADFEGGHVTVYGEDGIYTGHKLAPESLDPEGRLIGTLECEFEVEL